MAHISDSHRQSKPIWRPRTRKVEATLPAHTVRAVKCDERAYVGGSDYAAPLGGAMQSFARWPALPQFCKASGQMRPESVRQYGDWNRPGRSSLVAHKASAWSRRLRALARQVARLAAVEARSNATRLGAFPSGVAVLPAGIARGDALRVWAVARPMAQL